MDVWETYAYGLLYVYKSKVNKNINVRQSDRWDRNFWGMYNVHPMKQISLTCQPHFQEPSTSPGLSQLGWLGMAGSYHLRRSPLYRPLGIGCHFYTEKYIKQIKFEKINIQLDILIFWQHRFFTSATENIMGFSCQKLIYRVLLYLKSGLNQYEIPILFNTEFHKLTQFESTKIAQPIISTLYIGFVLNPGLNLITEWTKIKKKVFHNFFVINNQSVFYTIM